MFPQKHPSSKNNNSSNAYSENDHDMHEMHDHHEIDHTIRESKTLISPSTRQEPNSNDNQQHNYDDHNHHDTSAADEHHDSHEGSPTTSTEKSPEEIKKEAEAARPGSLKLCSVIVCNVIGAGILSLPTGASQSSLILGIIFLLFSAFISFVNVYFIIAAADYTNEMNFRNLIEVGLEPLGRIFPIIADLSLVVFPFGAIVAYVRVVANAMPPVLINFVSVSPDSFIASQLCWVLISGFCFFVMSCRRALSELFVVAIFGLLTIFFAIIVVMIRFFDGSYSESKTPAAVPENFESLFVNLGLFQFIPVAAFALSIQNNAPSFYGELKRRSPAKMMKIMGWAHIVIVIAYLAMMIFGLLTFGNESLRNGDGNILDSYREDDALANVARILMFVHFLGVFPILEVAVRKGVNNFILKGDETRLSFPMLILQTFIIVVIACVIAALVEKIDLIFSITGALFGSIVVFILPSLLFIRVVPYDYAGRKMNSNAKINNVEIPPTSGTQSPSTMTPASSPTTSTVPQIISESNDPSNPPCCCPNEAAFCYRLFDLRMITRRVIAYFSIFYGVLSCALGLYTTFDSVLNPPAKSSSNSTASLGTNNITGFW